MNKILIIFIILLLNSCRTIIKYNSDIEDDSKGIQFVGKASYYDDKFDNRITASGEIFKQSNLTAAHKKLEFGTKVKVTNLKNNLSVVVKINDRGPFVKDRIIDLSKSAAKAINMIDDGIVEVKIEIIN